MPTYSESETLKCDAVSLAPNVKCGSPVFLVDGKPLGPMPMCLDCHLVQCYVAGRLVTLGRQLRQPIDRVIDICPPIIREFTAANNGSRN